MKPFKVKDAISATHQRTRSVTKHVQSIRPPRWFEKVEVAENVPHQLATIPSLLRGRWEASDANHGISLLTRLERIHFRRRFATLKQGCSAVRRWKSLIRYR